MYFWIADRFRSHTQWLTSSGQARMAVAKSWVGPEANRLLLLTAIWCTVASVVVIYFQVYWHYWLAQLLGGYIINTLLPIAVLLGIATVFFINMHVFGHCQTIEAGDGTGLLWGALATYTMWAVCSVLLNETSPDRIQAYLIYVLSPPALFIALKRIYDALGVSRIKQTLWWLFLCAIGFSIYVASVYLAQDRATLADMSELETNRGIVQGDSGASYRQDSIDLYVKRFAIPGISSTTYGPMLVPIILVGWYFLRHANKSHRVWYFALLLFLSFCMVMTVSRGPILALTAGILYAAWWGWMKTRTMILVLTLAAVGFATVGIGTFIRLYATVATFLPMESVFPALRWIGIATDAAELAEGDPHLKSIDYSLMLIGKSPVFGVGRTAFAEFGIYEAETGIDHNNYLAIGGSFGIPALLAYALFLAMLFAAVHRTNTRLKRHPQQRDLGIALGAGLVALMAYLVAAPAEFQFIWSWFGLAAGWVASTRRTLLDQES